VGMMGPLVAGAVVLWLRGVRGHRPAIAALVTGGMVTVYWIFDLLVMTVSSE